MADDETYTLCPYCQQRIEPDDAGVVYAVEQREIRTFGGTDIVDGWGGFFHPGCSPEAIGWVRRERPSEPGD